MSEQRMYAETQHYAARTPGELDRLREQLGEAEAAASKEKDWSQRTRLEQSAKVLKRELAAAELEVKHERHREAQQSRPEKKGSKESTPAATQQKKVEPDSFESRMAQGTLVRSDCGTKFLLTNVPKSEKGKGTPAASTQAQFAEPTLYFAE